MKTAGAASTPVDSFTTTLWDVVVNAGQRDSGAGDQALAELFQTYHPPLYAFLRRKGKTAEDAEDLIQEFFFRFLKRGDLARVSPEKGKFRCFLLASIQHLIKDEWDKDRAAKRGGCTPPVSWDRLRGESLYLSNRDGKLEPEQVYDIDWARTVFARAGERLKEEYREKGKLELYEHLRACMTNETTAPRYEVLAEQLSVAEGTIKAEVHRLRRRFQELIRAEVANTMSEPAAVEEEIRYLITLVARWGV